MVELLIRIPYYVVQLFNVTDNWQPTNQPTHWPLNYIILFKCRWIYQFSSIWHTYRAHVYEKVKHRFDDRLIHYASYWPDWFFFFFFFFNLFFFFVNLFRSYHCCFRSLFFGFLNLATLELLHLFINIFSL